jgi:DNA-directed RNA polymerase specialized sigma24 family protein
MKVREIAAVLGISESEVKMRRLRAVSRLLEVLEDESEVR